MDKNKHSDQPIITVDYEKYAHFLEHADMNEEQKREYLQTIWNIIVEFVSLGFGVHPLQQAKKPCGKAKETAPDSAADAHDGVQYQSNILTNEFINRANLQADRIGKGGVK